MAITQYYVSPASGNDTTGDGSSGTPWATVQKALNTITRNATDGDQINLQAGGTDTLSAALTLATYGRPTQAAPLIIRGYTSAANDGGVGVISGGGSYAILTGTSNDCIYMIDLRLTNSGGNYLVAMRDYCSILNCEIDTSTAGGVVINGKSNVEHCYVHDCTGGHGIYISAGTGHKIRWNRVVGCGANTNNYQIAAEFWSTEVIGNICVPAAGRSGIHANGAGVRVDGNTIFCVSGTGRGINVNAVANIAIVNNIIEGFSGSGGTGITFNAAAVCALYHSNAFYNNATNVSGAPKVAGVTGNNDTLAASPFVDAANGDFDINGTVAGVTEDAWPSSFLGLASTSPKADKGAVQAGAGTGGAPASVPRPPAALDCLMVY